MLTSDQNLALPFDEQFVYVYLDDVNVTRTCRAFDLYRGWVDLLDESATKETGKPVVHRRSGKVVAIRRREVPAN